MKTLKESILSRSSHGAKGFEDQRRDEIEKWLDKYNIENYTINDDLTIDVNGSVYLNDQNLREFPDYIQFGVVWKSFNCNNNYLTSLRGVPREVKWGFYCAFNKFTSLEGSPEKVERDFDCSYNRLTSLKGAPREVRGSFDCSNNELTTLEGSPKEVETFDCSYNELTTLEGAPDKVGENFRCSKNNLISLKGAPKKTRIFDCSYNELTTLEGAPKKAGSFDCSDNSVRFTEEDVRRVCDVKGSIFK